ncbi:MULTISPECIES: hypothetical protein [unclassified Spirillospora]|uniref:hypothetical protein n=1 Tax=unclassified Spirillospora TaxID=2642701 RepID=UPI0037117EB1
MTGTGVGMVDAAVLEGRLREHHRRCLPALSRLKLLARDGWETATDVRAATAEVMVELDAAESILLDALSGSVRRDALAHFLACRVNRLTVIAEHAAVTADAGDLPVLRRMLYQFHALAVAMWKVQLGLQTHGRRPMIEVGAVPKPSAPGVRNAPARPVRTGPKSRPQVTLGR